jgi:hypothetical protein
LFLNRNLNCGKKRQKRKGQTPLWGKDTKDKSLKSRVSNILRITFAIINCIFGGQSEGIRKEGSANHETMKKDGSMD